MSTNINITVGGNSLVDQAKAQQQAARQAQLEKENRTRLEREAAQERTAALAAQGRDATGAPISGSLQRSAPQRDEPAASRFSIGYPVATGYYETSTTTYVDPATGTSQTDKTIYKIYSGDGSTFLTTEFEHPRFPLPDLKWGLPTYDFSRLFFQSDPACGTWSSGYTLEPPPSSNIRGLTNGCDGGFYYSLVSSTAHFVIELYRDEFLDAACTQPTGRRLWNNSPDENRFTPGRTNDNWLWWQSGPSFTPSQPHIVTKKFTWSYGPYINSYCLPVSKNSFIFYINFAHYKYFHYYGQQLSFSLTPASFGEYFFGISEGQNEFGQVRYYKIYWANGASAVTGTKDDEYDELYEEKQIYHRAFLVTSTSVKEVTVPTGLKANAENLHAALKNPPDWSANRPIDTSLSYQTYTKTPTGELRSQGSSRFPVYTTSNVETVARYGYNTSLTISQARPNPTVDASLLRAYGLGWLKIGSIPSLTFSPGTFSLLENGAAIRALTNGDPLLNYETVASTYLSTYPLTKIFIDTRPVTENSVSILKFPYTKERPAFSYSALPENVFQENKIKPTTVLTNKGNRVTVWDWSKSGFCKSKLLNLGFSPSDLTP